MAAEGVKAGKFLGNVVKRELPLGDDPTGSRSSEKLRL
jgi:hypothetical protein